MLETIRRYREEINQAAMGSIELHFNERSVKAKLVQHLPIANPERGA
jgi:hypothetical protein